MKTCTAPGCEKHVKAKSLCNTHYMRTFRTGTAADPIRATTAERFWSHVEKTEGCWNWTANKNSFGYGTMRHDSKLKKAHRISYELANGPIPDGLHIDHICRTRHCVKPAHLRLATPKQNLENLDGPHSHNVTSGVRGVYKARNNKWQARVTHNGKIYSAGHHATVPEAEAAIIAKRNELFTHNDADRRE